MEISIGELFLGGGAAMAVGAAFWRLARVEKTAEAGVTELRKEVALRATREDLQSGLIALEQKIRNDYGPRLSRLKERVGNAEIHLGYRRSPIGGGGGGGGGGAVPRTIIAAPDVSGRVESNDET